MELKQNKNEICSEFLSRLGMDGAKWAKEFMKLYRAQEFPTEWIDEDLMIGWFANAIMAGYDTANNRAHERVKELEAKLERYEKALEKIASFERNLMSAGLAEEMNEIANGALAEKDEG